MGNLDIAQQVQPELRLSLPVCLVLGFDFEHWMFLRKDVDEGLIHGEFEGKREEGPQRCENVIRTRNSYSHVFTNTCNSSQRPSRTDLAMSSTMLSKESEERSCEAKREFQRRHGNQNWAEKAARREVWWEG
jgi:hypothetical protein